MFYGKYRAPDINLWLSIGACLWCLNQKGDQENQEQAQPCPTCVSHFFTSPLMKHWLSKM
jgi:hypothetical protein